MTERGILCGLEDVKSGWDDQVARMEKRRRRLEQKTPEELVRDGLWLVGPGDDEEVLSEVLEDGSLCVWEDDGRGRGRRTVVDAFDMASGDADVRALAAEHAASAAASHAIRRLREKDVMPDGLRRFDLELEKLNRMFIEGVASHPAWRKHVEERAARIAAVMERAPRDQMIGKARAHSRQTAMVVLTEAIGEAMGAGLSDEDIRACLKRASAKEVLGS